MEAAKPEYMWLVDEWMECAQSLARECNDLHAQIKEYRERLAKYEVVDPKDK